MNLFGCKFCDNDTGRRRCGRKNFDSLLWAIVTVFQVTVVTGWRIVQCKKYSAWPRCWSVCPSVSSSTVKSSSFRWFPSFSWHHIAIPTCQKTGRFSYSHAESNRVPNSIFKKWTESNLFFDVHILRNEINVLEDMSDSLLVVKVDSIVQ